MPQEPFTSRTVLLTGPLQNTPDVDSLLQVPLGQDKITSQVDTKLRNACSYTILMEDHTLANLLWASLLSNPDVLFAGYKVPHPLEPKIVLK